MAKVKECLYCYNKDLSYVTYRSDKMNVVRCSRCGVMMVESISDDTEALYTSEYFEKPSDTKSGYTDYLSAPAVNLIGKYGFTRLFARNAKRHLDLGCADGSLIEIFKNEGIESAGLEISKDAVKIAKNKGLDVSFSRLHSFPKSLVKSDVITAFDLLEHADQPGKVLNAIYENLTDDGYFVFSTLCVQKPVPEDYWFNHSLEHYIYYDKKSLTFILSEIFGKDNFAFAEIEIGGIAEFWGVAKKGVFTKENKLIAEIKKSAFLKNDKESGYLMSLFYNQLARFEQSEKIIKSFAKAWPKQQVLTATFYNLFYQGKYQKALQIFDSEPGQISLSNAVFWQALAYTRMQFDKIILKEFQDHDSKELLIAHEEIDTLRTELDSYANSSIHQRIRKIGGIKRKALNSHRFTRTAATKSRSQKVIFDKDKKRNVLITIPWMTFGGAETLIYNFTRELVGSVNITFVTGLTSKNEWEYKFRDVSSDIHHLPKIMESSSDYEAYVLKLIGDKHIQTLHIIHNGFTFRMLPAIKKRYPHLQIVLTLFNDRVPEYMAGAVDYQKLINIYTTDNRFVIDKLSPLLNGREVVLIPNGVDTKAEFNSELFDRDKSRIDLGLDEKDVAIFFIGRMSPEKNPQVFINAAKINVKQNKHLKFFLIGDGPMMDEISTNVEKLKNQSIRVLGYRSDVAKCLSAADIMILPSSIEGLPLSILEAMSMNVAVIASAVGAIPDIIQDGDNGYTVPVGDSLAISEVVGKLAQDTDLLETIKAAGKKTVTDSYTSHIAAAKYLLIYERQK